METKKGIRLVQDVQVKNPMGLHTRPATTIVSLLQRRRSLVLLTHRNETVDAKSILNVLILAAPRNAIVTITVEGEDPEDAHATMNSLVHAFDTQFGERL